MATKKKPAHKKASKPVKKATNKKPAPKKEEKKEKSESAKGRKTAAITFLAVGGVSGLSTLITGIKAANFRNIIDTLENPDMTQEEWKKYDPKFKAARATTVITGIVSGITLPISLFLFIKKEKSTMTQKVSVNVEGGIDRVGLRVNARF